MLLSRKDFREGVLRRDSNKCVVCGADAVDAHHLIERRFWEDEGYHMGNGASVCREHHLLAETNHICPDVVRMYAGIQDKKYPKKFDCEKDYDKWGEVIKIPTREDIKYPTTHYFNFSPTIMEDLAECVDVNDFLNVPLIITIKMDGSNAKVTRDYVAARNGSQANHKSFDMLKAMHSSFREKIPENLIVFGEWLFALHSIKYEGETALDSYFQIFGAYMKKERLFLGWDGVEKVAKLLGFPTAPVIGEFRFEKDWQLIRDVVRMGDEVIESGHEGIVVRSKYPFHYGQFGRLLGKYVRPEHVQTDIHWTKNKVIKNEVKW